MAHSARISRIRHHGQATQQAILLTGTQHHRPRTHHGQMVTDMVDQGR
jgi:hypothetical protein